MVLLCDFFDQDFVDNAGETPGTLAAATGCTAVCGALEVGPRDCMVEKKRVCFLGLEKKLREQVTPSVWGFHPCSFCMAFLVGFQGLWRYAAECRATVFWPLVRCKPQWSQLFVVFVRKVCRLDTSETQRKKRYQGAYSTFNWCLAMNLS